MSMKVYCSHSWGTDVEFREGTESYMGRICAWCRGIWKEGEPWPAVQTGYVINE